MKPNTNRAAQAIWDVLRKAGESPLTVGTLIMRTNVSHDTVYPILRRWLAEKLVTTERLHGLLVFKITRDLGPLAPIMRGILSYGRGYTNPNERDE